MPLLPTMARNPVIPGRPEIFSPLRVFCLSFRSRNCKVAPAIKPTPTTNQLQLMSDKSIEARVKDIIVDQLGVNADQVTIEAKFVEDLGADSLDTVELVMAFEEEFDIEVPDEEAEKLQSVGDVISYINSQQG